MGDLQVRSAKPDFDAFFDSYVAAYNRSLSERVDVKAIRSHFSESFIAAGPGSVMTGDNDEAFGETLEKGYAFYKSIGTKKMEVTGVDVTDIDDGHSLAKVHYRAEYEKDGETIAIPFSVSYMLEERDGHLKIFGFVAGDEMALYRQYGLTLPAEAIVPIESRRSLPCVVGPSGSRGRFRFRRRFGGRLSRRFHRSGIFNRRCRLGLFRCRGGKFGQIVTDLFACICVLKGRAGPGRGGSVVIGRGAEPIDEREKDHDPDQSKDQGARVHLAAVALPHFGFVELGPVVGHSCIPRVPGLCRARTGRRDAVGLR
jgi:hypothetical protein